LRWGRVDLAANQIAIVESAEQTKTGIRYKPPKSGKGRTVALSATIAEELRAWRIRQAQELLQMGVRQSDETFVCALEDNSPLRPNTLTIQWARIAARLDLPRGVSAWATAGSPSLSTYTAMSCRGCRKTPQLAWMTRLQAAMRQRQK
jgi:integrase